LLLIVLTNVYQEVAREQQVAHRSSTISGCNPDGSAQELTNSPSGTLCPLSRDSSPSNSSPSNSTAENTNNNSPNPSNNNDDNDEDLDLSTLSTSSTTTAKMASFDLKLEHLVQDIMKYNLAHPFAMALKQAYITTFDDFRSIEIADVNNYTVTVGTSTVKVHATLVKAVQRGVAYAHHKEDMNNTESDDSILWDANTFSKWTRNGYVNYLNTTAAAAAALAAMGRFRIDVSFFECAIPCNKENSFEIIKN
jgi:hypothetical protein